MYGYQRARQRLQQYPLIADRDFRNQAVGLMNRVAEFGGDYRENPYTQYNSLRNAAKYAVPVAAAAGKVLQNVDKHYGLKQAPSARKSASRRKNLRTVAGQQKITNYFPRTNIPAHLRTSSQRTAYAHQYLPLASKDQRHFQPEYIRRKRIGWRKKAFKGYTKPAKSSKKKYYGFPKKKRPWWKKKKRSSGRYA